jgi:hypothetical protein
VITTWRRRHGEEAMREPFARVAGPIVDPTPTPGARAGAALRCARWDGFQTKTPENEENRAAFGSSGTCDDSARSPAVIATAGAGRANPRHALGRQRRR